GAAGLKRALADDQRRGANPRRAVEGELDGQHQELAVRRRVFSRRTRRGDGRQRIAAGAAFGGPVRQSSAGKLLDLRRELLRDRLAAFERTRDAIEPRLGRSSAVVLRKRARAAYPAALVGDGRAHREAIL